jgi:hypothetical protein
MSTRPSSVLAGAAFLAGMSAGVFGQWEEIYDFLTDEAIFLSRPRRTRDLQQSLRDIPQPYTQLKACFEHDQTLYGRGGRSPAE